MRVCWYNSGRSELGGWGVRLARGQGRNIKRAGRTLESN